MKKDNYKKFLDYSEKKIIENEIAQAESNTSGEIRVHLINSEKIGDIMKEAHKWFKKLKMHKTRDQNGILLLIAPNAKKFAIIGDKAINEKIKDSFWDEIRDNITNAFKGEKFVDGIVSAVKETGKILSIHFPIKPDDVNELSNEVTES